MTEMLTSKEMQNILQVDRSTIYRMAESGRLPAIKVGKQWRFPKTQVDSWLSTQGATAAAADGAAERRKSRWPLRRHQLKVISPRCFRCNVCSKFRIHLPMLWV